MKKNTIAPCLGLVAAFLLPLFWGSTPQNLPQEAVQASAPTAEAERAAVITASPEETVPAFLPSPKVIRVKTGQGVMDMDMQEYLVGVVAAEMPASFEGEALKAQAVAARTYAMYCMDGKRHDDAQICTDYSCCQSWVGDAQLREQWGSSYEKNRQIIADAVYGTAGQYLEYDGQPVFAAFHSSSASATEDCGNVWNDKPYLVSVASPETAADVPDYVSFVRSSPLDFRDTVLYAFPSADFTSDESQWIGQCTRDGSGRVESLVLGGMEIGGTTLRSLFKLRSTAFDLSYADGIFTFTVTGYGHGVGMSQYGANVMAKSGADYTEILAHYYQGTTLVS